MDKTTNYDSIFYDLKYYLSAFKTAAKASNWKSETQKFTMDYLQQLVRLKNELINRTYTISERREFILNERGKIRLIRSAPFRDRVVRHLICDYILEPILRKFLIYDNGSSLKGKGISFTRNRLKTHLRKYFQNNKSNDGWILLMDYSGYYDNINHDRLIESVEKHIPENNPLTRWLLRLIVKSFEQDVSFLSDEDFERMKTGKYKAIDYYDIPKSCRTGEKILRKSVDIGDQCSQILGIYYPTELDNFIKIVLSEKYYGRYMDDSYVISNSKNHLKTIYKKIVKKASELGIMINVKKLIIQKISKTFKFLQDKYFMTETGKIVERINPVKLRRMRHRLKELFVKILDGEVEFESVSNMLKSWIGSYYNKLSKYQLCGLIKYYNNLFLNFE